VKSEDGVLRRLSILGVLLGTCLPLNAESVPSQNQYVAKLREESATQHLRAQNTIREAVRTKVESQLTEWGKTIFLRNWKSTRNSTIDSVQKQLDDLSEFTLFSENELEPSSQNIKRARKLTFGWNLKTNLSKIEYIEENLYLGFYQHQTWNFLIGRVSLSENTYFNLSKKWEDKKTTATLQFPIGLPYYSASISRELSTTISSTFSSQIPIRGTQLARSFEIKVSFLF